MPGWLGRARGVRSRRATAIVCAAAVALIAGVATAVALDSARHTSRTTAGGAPVADVVRTPGENETHAMTVMAFPYDRKVWGRQPLRQAQIDIAGIAKEIAKHEPVLMAAAPGQVAAAKSMCGPTVNVQRMVFNDCWTRDMGPIFVYRNGQPVGLDWGFNGWGRKFPWRKDDAFPIPCLRYLGVPRKPVDMVFEGGQVLIDGQGTLITTEETMLNPNRNPGTTKQQIEDQLKAQFGVTKVVWLPYGQYGDDITDGHVDGVANFIAPGKLMIQVTAPGTPDYDRLQTNKAVLQAATDARGRHFQLVELSQYPTVRFGSYATTHSYINYYVCNGAVIVPIAGLPTDPGALVTIRAAFPNRTVVGVNTLGLTYGGGGAHCVTQQVPAPGRVSSSPGS